MHLPLSFSKLRATLPPVHSLSRFGSSAVFVAVALTLFGCPKQRAGEVCAADKKFVIAEPEVPPLTAAQIEDRGHDCMTKMNSLATGSVDCMANCYGEATSRGALFDCDRKCQVTIQK